MNLGHAMNNKLFTESGCLSKYVLWTGVQRKSCDYQATILKIGQILQEAEMEL